MPVPFFILKRKKKNKTKNYSNLGREGIFLKNNFYKSVKIYLMSKNCHQMSPCVNIIR